MVKPTDQEMTDIGKIVYYSLLPRGEGTPRHGGHMEKHQGQEGPSKMGLSPLHLLPGAHLWARSPQA